MVAGNIEHAKKSFLMKLAALIIDKHLRNQEYTNS